MDNLNENIQNTQSQDQNDVNDAQSTSMETNLEDSRVHQLSPATTPLDNILNAEVDSSDPPNNMAAEENDNLYIHLDNRIHTSGRASTAMNTTEMYRGADDNLAADLWQPIANDSVEISENSNRAVLLRRLSDFEINALAEDGNPSTVQSYENSDMTSNGVVENRERVDSQLMASTSFHASVSPLVPQPIDAIYNEGEGYMESDDVTSELGEIYNVNADESDSNARAANLDQLMTDDNNTPDVGEAEASSPDEDNELSIRNSDGELGAAVNDNPFAGLAAIEGRILQNVASASLLQRDSFMQRFRRILFILSSRRRRLIRLGLIAPESDEADENPRETLEHLARSLGVPLEIDDLEDLRPRRSRPEENLPENAVRFDTNLPAEHTYMGSNMNRVSGVNYLETGQQHNLMLFMHQEILFPGEILPFMISALVIEGGPAQGQDGLLFGICFPFINDKKNPTYLYGITCHIYEKGSDNRGNTLIKSRALQRFVIKTKDLIGSLEYINDHPTMKCYHCVEILPDIYLPDPLGCINMGSMSRFRDCKSVRNIYRRFQVSTTPWPLPVYDYYSLNSIVEKARTQLAQHKIDTMPSDPTQLSYWLVRNLHLSEGQIHTIFLTNCVNKRLKIIASTFKAEAVFSCRFCTNNIASCRELFAMSKHGVQTQYCNSAGFIHKTNTVYHVNTKAIIYSGTPSSEFSWFPGYQWQIILCKVCKHHMGWEYKAIDLNLVPKQFYGISSSSVRICSTQVVGDEDRMRSSLQLNSIRALFNSHRNAYGMPFDDIETNTDDSSDSL